MPQPPHLVAPWAPGPFPCCFRSGQCLADHDRSGKHHFNRPCMQVRLAGVMVMRCCAMRACPTTTMQALSAAVVAASTSWFHTRLRLQKHYCSLVPHHTKYEKTLLQSRVISPNREIFNHQSSCSPALPGPSPGADGSASWRLAGRSSS